MKLQFRLFRIMVAAFMRQRNFELKDTSILWFILMPWDCVLTRAGNDRYHSFMDLGRIDIAIRFGLWKTIFKPNWKPFVISVHIRYNESLKMFQRFSLRTRVIYWDSHFIWIEHVFERKGKTIATAISKNVAIGKGGIVRTSLIFRPFIRDLQSPLQEKVITLVNAMDGILRNIL